MNTLDITQSCGLTPKKAATTHGGEYHGPCPMCGGTDRFIVWPVQGENGTFYCRRCEKGGDAIQLLIEAKQMSFKEACLAVGRDLPEQNRRRTPMAPGRRREDRRTTWTPRTTTDPAEIWRIRADAFVEAAHKGLLTNKTQLAWLAKRGISVETVRLRRLGWNRKDLFRDKLSWGIPDNGKKLWLPEGLVIPYEVGDNLLRIRVRKATLRDNNDGRYYIVPGSSSAAMILAAVSFCHAKRGGWIIVESELDAILVAQEAGDVVGVMALGNSSSKPDEAAATAINGAAYIMNSLDFDAAGAKAWEWWKKSYPQADRWPVPDGKDPGEYRGEKGGDVRGWVIRGLPYGLRPQNKIKSIEDSTSVVDRAAPSPQPSPLPSTSSGREREISVPDACALIPYTTIDLLCRSCGWPMRLYVPLRHRRRQERISCSECLLAADESAA